VSKGGEPTFGTLEKNVSNHNGSQILQNTQSYNNTLYNLDTYL